MYSIWAYLGSAMALVFGALALWRGGPAERSGAVVILTAWFITPFLQKNYDPTIWGVVVDVTAFVLMLGISIWSRRIWSLFATACSFAGVLAHIGAGLALNIGYNSYLTTLMILSGYGVAFSLVGAVIESEVYRRRAQAQASVS
ncbi:hypothetical protein PQU92_09435 [Asticcacaulis sp. BYS171W]|uniref:Uncharacterized protein n=1 Tax=Asticcacaulis aquaticus TaxID=2984212 RepID=A0ABT5HU99_9CAUL|nr:hypothetical protein [Asticcacaulis aquaticus]MDC7683497.1 hypothetical protein [Asticcacaulis aquaticus]